MIQIWITMVCSTFFIAISYMTLLIKDSNTATGMFFSEAIIFNNGHLEIVASSPKNKNPNISASFLIIAEFLFMLCSWITSSSFLDTSLMLRGIQVLETFLSNYSTISKFVFWERLKERTYEIIISSMEILRRLLLEVIYV